MAVFSLKYSPTAEETKAFLKDGERILTGIPGVEHFEVLRQISMKTDFDFGFSMELNCQEAYNSYNEHPSHQAFVEERWKTEVEKFQELDFIQVNR